MMNNLLEIKKEMLDNLLSRCYDIEFNYFTELETIIDNYEQEDCYKWKKEKIINIFYMIEKELNNYEDPQVSGAWELGYYAGYKQAFDDIKKEK